MLLRQQTYKTRSYYHLVTAEPPFVRTRINRMQQTNPLKGVTQSSFTKSVVMSVAVSKNGSCSLSSLKWKVNGQYWWDILLS